MKKVTAMNLPNKLTLSRILFALLFVSIFLCDSLISNNYIIACIIFVIATLTDFLDGCIARRKNKKLETVFGIVFDPIADRVLMASALVLFVYTNALHPAVAILLISRDILMSGIRILLGYQKQLLISATCLGKMKMVSEVILVLLLFANHFWCINDSILLTISITSIFSALISLAQCILKHRNDIFHEIYTRNVEVK